jgi:hypothetical protein
LEKTKQYVKITSAVADMMVKHGIALNGTVSGYFQQWQESQAESKTASQLH